MWKRSRPHVEQIRHHRGGGGPPVRPVPRTARPSPSAKRTRTPRPWSGWGEDPQPTPPRPGRRSNLARPRQAGCPAPRPAQPVRLPAAAACCGSRHVCAPLPLFPAASQRQRRCASRSGDSNPSRPACLARARVPSWPGSARAIAIPLPHPGRMRHEIGGGGGCLIVDQDGQLGTYARPNSAMVSGAVRHDSDVTRTRMDA